jgi:hypothetical protein
VSRLPLRYLRHTVAIDGATVRCLVDSRGAGLNVARASIGSETAGAVTVYCALATVCDLGAEVVLPDGRVGYAASVVRHDGGGLATPDHTEILWAPARTLTQASEYE